MSSSIIAKIVKLPSKLLRAFLCSTKWYDSYIKDVPKCPYHAEATMYKHQTDITVDEEMFYHKFGKFPSKTPKMEVRIEGTVTIKYFECATATEPKHHFLHEINWSKAYIRCKRHVPNNNPQICGGCYVWHKANPNLLKCNNNIDKCSWTIPSSKFKSYAPRVHRKIIKQATSALDFDFCFYKPSRSISLWEKLNSENFNKPQSLPPTPPSSGPAPISSPPAGQTYVPPTPVGSTPQPKSSPPAIPPGSQPVSPPGTSPPPLTPPPGSNIVIPPPIPTPSTGSSFPDGDFKGSPPVSKPKSKHKLTSNIILKNGNYILTELLTDSGGFARIYLGSQKNSNDLIVAKTLKDHSEMGNITIDTYNNTVVKEFDREIEFMKKVKGCDGFVEYIDDCTHNNKKYLIMNYVPGITLQEYLEKGGKKLTEEQAIYLTYEIAKRVKTIHDLNQVHRDLKPHNIILVGKKPILIDFGAIREKIQATGKTKIFSAGYAAPEQQMRGYVTPYGDIYSVAMILVTLLIGTSKFSRSTKNDKTYLQLIFFELKPIRDDIKKLIEDQITKDVNNYQDRYPIDRFITALERIALPILCPGCQNILQSGQTFCTKCGAIFELCPGCNFPVDKSNKVNICSNCNMNLNWCPYCSEFAFTVPVQPADIGKNKFCKKCGKIIYVCRNCKTVVKPDDSTCYSCGTPIEFCLNCQNIITPNLDKCPDCSSPLIKCRNCSSYVDKSMDQCRKCFEKLFWCAYCGAKMSKRHKKCKKCGVKNDRCPDCNKLIKSLADHVCPLKPHPLNPPTPPGSSIECVVCHTMNLNTAKFCKGCGHQINKPPPPINSVECLDCHTENSEESKFCKKCGKELPKICAGCGTKNLDSAAFCKTCGRPITKPKPPISPLKCLVCHTENNNISKFCKKCGEKLPVLCTVCHSMNIDTSKFCKQCGKKLIQNP